MKAFAVRFIEEIDFVCDRHHRKKLKGRGEYAMHVFKHELLAAYFRACETVPADLVNEILGERIAKAAKQKEE